MELHPMAATLKTLIIILFFPLILYSQSPDIKFERIMVEDGLPNGFVHDILQDQQGFMWIATENGLSKYDGYKFTNYRHDPDDSSSISSNLISALHEDRSGLLWVSTWGGLNKFIREKEVFIRYGYDRDNPASIGSNHVECIDDFSYEGKDVLWLGTATGLNKLDPETGEFTRYPHTNRGHPYRFVEALVVDTSGNVWVGSTEGGLHKFNPETRRYIHYRHDPGNPKSLSSNLVWSLFEDQTGILWIGTSGGGLNKYDSLKDQFISYHHDPSNPISLGNDIVLSIFEDKAGKLWVGSGEGGLNIFNRTKEEFTRYIHDPDDPNSLSDNTVMCIDEDKSGMLWVGTWGGGLNKIDPQKSQFSQIRHLPGNKNSLSNNDVTCVYESHYGGEAVLWIGTKNGGLNKLNRAKKQYISYQHNPDNPNSLSNNFVFSICESRSEILWIGNFYGGLNKFNRRTGQFTRYMYDPDSPNSLSCKSVRCIVEDKTGMLWIGTQTGGINTFDPITEQFTLVSKKMQIIQIYQDRSDELWFATLQGLKKLDRETGQFTTYWHNPEDPNSISHNYIMSIYESNSGDFWVGTYGGGLNLFDRETGKFIRYTVKDGLPNDMIVGILEDEQNNLWLATSKGLSKFNLKTEAFRNYDYHDGLLGDQFEEGAYFKSRDGEMFFGSINGLNAFYPKNIKYNMHIPPVFITDFRIFNKPVLIKKDDNVEQKSVYTLPGHISTMDEIELSYKENVFSFEFAALDYHSPMKNRYAYKMEGVDPDWVFTDASHRFVSYTQFDPGTYAFKIKGSNNDGLWNEEGTSIRIIITPPWWRTNLAYIFYTLIIVIIVLGIWRNQTNRLKMKHQMDLDHLQTEKLEEVDRMKSRFFANISHEFRTPLTLIKGPVKQIISGDFKGNLIEQCKMILRNSDRLLGLINQILDLSKLESGGMKLQVSEAEIIRYLKGMVHSFASLAEQKKITLQFNITEATMVGFVDRDKLERIVTNLLSNAFKFTPVGGEIVVALSLRGDLQTSRSTKQSPYDGNNEIAVSPPASGTRNDNSKSQIPNSNFVEISITNTGSGIPSDRLDKIFDRFYHADTNYKKDSEGTGIGLALTKELVELHHGTINVSTDIAGQILTDKLTVFTIQLPIGREHFTDDEIVEESLEPEYSNEQRASSIRKSEANIQKPASSIPDKSGSPLHSDQHPGTILIVEDNPDVISYICSFLENEYRILTAENGKEGFKKAIAKFPQLIISDVMMPEMDGFEFCKKVKSDERTSHIPVILLTARADMESKIEGLEFGADDYISKPFDADELKVRSINLIEQRKKLCKKFSRLIEIKPGEVVASSMDEQFLERLLTVFEKHLSESGYSTENFAREVGMSRSQLNRKLKAITNLSTHKFILNLRLKRAAQLLKRKTGTIFEIADVVGFENPSKFAHAFRTQYGKSPSDFSSMQNR